MQWRELDEARAVWTIPAERAKNNTEHQVPLPAAAWDILNALPRVTQATDADGEPAVAVESPFVFTTTAITSVSGYSRAKRLLDVAAQEWLNERAEKIGNPVPKLAAWRIHDFRRTLSTGLARKGCPQHVVEKLLNHRSGMTSGIAGVYNRYQYLDERRTALSDWSDHISTLIKSTTNGPTSAD